MTHTGTRRRSAPWPVAVVILAVAADPDIVAGERANAAVKLGIDLGAGRIMWAQQAVNLREAALKYGG